MIIEKMMEMGVWYIPGKNHYHFTMRWRNRNKDGEIEKQEKHYCSHSYGVMDGT